jgi:hypothetical protein
MSIFKIYPHLYCSFTIVEFTEKTSFYLETINILEPSDSVFFNEFKVIRVVILGKFIILFQIVCKDCI